MDTARLRELATEGAAAITWWRVGDPEPAAWSHRHLGYRRLSDGSIEALVYSRRAETTYHVAAAYCSCDHWTRRCQRAEEPVGCKHIAICFPGGELPAGVDVPPLAIDERRERMEAARREVAALLG